jgi:hypothetical protein
VELATKVAVGSCLSMVKPLYWQALAMLVVKYTCKAAMAVFATVEGSLFAQVTDVPLAVHAQ